MPKYQLSWLKADLIAGLTICAVMVPEAMAYAGIAGVTPLIGLYTVPIPLFVYALLGTSRTMVIGPDSATALISSVTIGSLVASGSSEYLTLTAALAMMVGIFFRLLFPFSFFLLFSSRSFCPYFFFAPTLPLVSPPHIEKI